MKKLRFFNEDRAAFAVIIFVAILILDLIASIAGFGGAFFLSIPFEMPMFSTYESLVLSILAVISVLLLILYSYRKNQQKKLKVLAVANLIFSVAPLILNSLYYPFSYLITEALCDLTGTDDAFHFSDVKFFIAEIISVPFFILSVVLLYRLKNSSGKKDVKRLPFYVTVLITAAVFTIVTVISYIICNTPVSELFNFSVLEYLK